MLSATGEETDTDTGRSYRAKDGDGHVVIVSVSTEALQDYGEDAAWEAADRKYDAGDYEELEGGRRKVRVTTSDIG